MTDDSRLLHVYIKSRDVRITQLLADMERLELDMRTMGTTAEMLQRRLSLRDATSAEQDAVRKSLADVALEREALIEETEAEAARLHAHIKRCHDILRLNLAQADGAELHEIETLLKQERD